MWFIGLISGKNQALGIPLQSISAQVSESVSSNPVYCEDPTPHIASIPFLGPNYLFSIFVPIHWTHTSENGDVYHIDTFQSPVTNAAIQNITYDDGKNVTRGVADTIALDFLKEIYAKDVFISKASVQSDNSTLSIWRSLSGSFQRTTFYGTRGTTFLILTIMYINDQRILFSSPGFHHIFLHHPTITIKKTISSQPFFFYLYIIFIFSLRFFYVPDIHFEYEKDKRKRIKRGKNE